MRWFKVAAIAVGVMIAFLIISSVIGFLVEAVIAVIAVAAVALAIKIAFNRRRISWQRRSTVNGPRYNKPLRRRDTPDVDEELARLRRDAGD